MVQASSEDLKSSSESESLLRWHVPGLVSFGRNHELVISTRKVIEVGRIKRTFDLRVGQVFTSC